VPIRRLICQLSAVASVAALPSCATITECHYSSSAALGLSSTQDTPRLVNAVGSALKPLGYSDGARLPPQDKELYGFSVGGGLHLVHQNRIDVRLDAAAHSILIYDYQEYSRSDFMNRTEEAIRRELAATYGEQVEFKRGADHSGACALPLGP